MSVLFVIIFLGGAALLIYLLTHRKIATQRAIANGYTFRKVILYTLLFIAIGLFGFIATSSPTETPTNSTKQEQKSTPAAENQSGTPAEQIEQICRQKAGDKYFTKVEVNEDMSKENFGKGKLIVLPYVKDEAGFRQTGFALSGEIIRALYESGLPISEVTVFVQDMSGHTTMKCTMDETTAKNIDWNTVSYKHFDKYLDDLWMIPQLRN